MLARRYAARANPMPTRRVSKKYGMPLRLAAAMSTALAAQQFACVRQPPQPRRSLAHLWLPKIRTHLLLEHCVRQLTTNARKQPAVLHICRPFNCFVEKLCVVRKRELGPCNCFAMKPCVARNRELRRCGRQGWWRFKRRRQAWWRFKRRQQGRLLFKRTLQQQDWHCRRRWRWNVTNCWRLVCRIIIHYGCDATAAATAAGGLDEHSPTLARSRSSALISWHAIIMRCVQGPPTRPIK